jgi:hypothetical protein
MGLDQYIYRISKPKLEDVVYTSEEICDMNLSKVTVEDAQKQMSLLADVIPYTIKRNIVIEYYDIKKIITDYNLPSDSHIGMMSYDGIRLYGYDVNGKYVESPLISDEELNSKYTYTKEVPCYIWKEKEIQYWRKNYPLQSWMNIENTGYRILDSKRIRETNEAFKTNVPEEDPDEETALFYWEWY